MIMALKPENLGQVSKMDENICVVLVSQNSKQFFWYRFVPINMSAIDSGRIAKIYPHAVKQYLPDGEVCD